MTDVLHGWRVLVTRPAAQAERLSDLIRKRGGEALQLPVIEISPPADPPETENLLCKIGNADLGIFVSRNAVIWTWKLLGENRGLPGNMRLLAVGEGTAAELSQAGLDQVAHAGGRADSEALLQLPDLQAERVRGKHVLIFRGMGGREVLADTLRKRGASVEYIEVYRREAPSYRPEEIDAVFRPRPPDIVVITSSEGLKNLFGMLSSDWRTRLLESQLVVIGSRPATLAREAGFRKNPVIARHANDEGLLAAVLEIAGAKEK